MKTEGAEERSPDTSSALSIRIEEEGRREIAREMNDAARKGRLKKPLPPPKVSKKLPIRGDVR